MFLEGYKVIDLALHYNHITEIIIRRFYFIYTIEEIK